MKDVGLLGGASWGCVYAHIADRAPCGVKRVVALYNSDTVLLSSVEISGRACIHQYEC